MDGRPRDRRGSPAGRRRPLCPGPRPHAPRRGWARGPSATAAASDASAQDEMPRARLTGPRRYVRAVADAAGIPHAAIRLVPSLAYRLSLVAIGEADIAIAGPNANDWDVAAADLLVHEAGGRLGDLRRCTDPLQHARRPPPGPGCRQRAALARRGCTGRGDRSASRIGSATNLGPTMTVTPQPEGVPDRQLLHLVFGGELDSLERLHFADLSAARYRRHLPQLPDRL